MQEMSFGPGDANPSHSACHNAWNTAAPGATGSSLVSWRKEMAAPCLCAYSLIAGNVGGGIYATSQSHGQMPGTELTL